MNGLELILDADADTSITADTDDQIDIKISGADDFQFTANTFTVLSGSTLTVASGATIANSGTATGFGVSLANDTNNYVTTATGSSGLNGEANLTFDGSTLAAAGNITATGTVEPAGDTSAGDNSALGYTSVLGAILTGQGSTNDVTLVNDADATVLGIPTGTTNVTIAGDLTLTGTTPTLTIGDAGAEDTKIVFDGNAQDYYIGLDDTDDDFKIGLGSAVGTTAHIVIDEAGAVTKPLQPMFHVRNSSSLTNVTGDGTSYTIIWNSDQTDVGNNVASGVFTVPITGNYLFTTAFLLAGLTSSHTNLDCDFVCSASDNSRIAYRANLGAQHRSSYFVVNSSFIDHFDAGETVHVRLAVHGSSKVVDIDYAFNTNFCGYLLG
jgi:hypothetical protein